MTSPGGAQKAGELRNASAVAAVLVRPQPRIGGLMLWQRVRSVTYRMGAEAMPESPVLIVLISYRRSADRLREIWFRCVTARLGMVRRGGCGEARLVRRVVVFGAAASGKVWQSRPGRAVTWAARRSFSFAELRNSNDRRGFLTSMTALGLGCAKTKDVKLRLEAHSWYRQLVDGNAQVSVAGATSEKFILGVFPGDAFLSAIPE
jgi:hypothetical protein